MVAAYINSGSRYENATNNGASNLITRLATKVRKETMVCCELVARKGSRVMVVVVVALSR